MTTGNPEHTCNSLRAVQIFRVLCRHKHWSGHQSDGIALIALARKVGVWYLECEPRRQMFTWLGLRSSDSRMLAAAGRGP